jgi:hypothetical protein
MNRGLIVLQSARAAAHIPGYQICAFLLVLI